MKLSPSVGVFTGGGQKGQVLPLALVFVVIAGLLLVFLVPHFSAVARSQAAMLRRERTYWVAEAGIKRVLADLVHGADPLSLGYSLPSVELNGLRPELSVSQVVTELPEVSELWFDPGVADPHLARVRAGSGYLLRVRNVRPGRLEINWAYHPAGKSKLGVWVGPLSLSPGRLTSWPAAKPLYEQEAEGEGNHLGPVTLNSPGVYDIVFYNPLWTEKKRPGGKASVKNTDKLTHQFAAGRRGATWVRVKAGKDYSITSSAGGTTIKAWVRQMPGPCEPPEWKPGLSSWQENKLVIFLWQVR